jgi:hypothetical protein
MKPGFGRLPGGESLSCTLVSLKITFMYFSYLWPIHQVMVKVGVI